MFSYKNNRIEAVVFAFYKDGKVLIENRPNNPDHTGPKTNFFPSGKIDNEDHDHDEDYKIVALKREVSEEFEDKISFADCTYLGELEAAPVNIHFYIYLITEFQGEFPEYTIEDGKKFATLFWIDMKDQKEYFIHDTAFQICDMIRGFLIKQQKSTYSQEKDRTCNIY